eukprot:CAMPEP_0172371158 /NCGR_PEP_ID=MMETSP1060-20121228/41412_1 /TAXON_ID=37318 /ORGANISM="Pseudo-nitzschia pungens, Strain cf. cingulata" /LENGTH=346 /DNA_ID=CAMNT_0013096683 /DNA_START=31 /DNA_END=1071 /DNA_ORIENTATION=+
MGMKLRRNQANQVYDVARVTERSVQPRSIKEVPLMNNVDDIDVEEIGQVVYRMKEKESNVYHCNCKERRDIALDELVSLWRQMLVNWMYYVVECCDLQQHSVAVATYFLDVAMLRGLCRTREEHQLAAATSLQMAFKTFDTAVIKLDKLVKLGRGLFTEDDVAVMEMKIIKSLDWNLHPPTPYCYLRQFERLIPTETRNSTKEVIGSVTKLIAEELTLDDRYIRYYPSTQGYSAILVALDFIPDDNFPQHLRRTFVMRLETSMKLDSDSPLVSRVTNKIYRTLKHADKLDKIIDISLATIKSTSNAHYQEVLGNVEKNSTKTRDGAKVSEEQHSPRDVKEKLRIKI